MDQIVTTNEIISNPKVSVVVFVFNHEKFLNKALQSIEAQNLSVDFEIIVHDDASQDGSKLIYENFLSTSKHNVTLIRQKLNKVGRSISFWPEIIERCRGELITFCDGDDYWVTPIKLQNQLTAMEVLPSVDLCFHGVTKVNHESEAPTGTLGDYGAEPRLFTIATVVEGDGGFMPTASLMLRRTVMLNLPKWFFSPPPIEDYFLQVLGSLRGGALYLPMRAAAYREGDPQAWTQRININPKLKIAFERRLIVSLFDMAKTLPSELLPHLEKMLMRYFFQLCHGAITQGQHADVWAMSTLLHQHRQIFECAEAKVDLKN